MQSKEIVSFLKDLSDNIEQHGLGLNNCCANDLFTIIYNLDNLKSAIYNLSMSRFASETIAFRDVVEKKFNLDETSLKELAFAIGKRAIEVENEYLESVKASFSATKDKLKDQLKGNNTAQEILDKIAILEFEQLERKEKKVH
jgi:hypothetical protein